MSNPFSSTVSRPGHGLIHLALLPPNTPRLKTVSYRYPLKLVSPSSFHITGPPIRVVQIVYLLTYGGGLVAGDSIDLHVVVEPATRLVLLTQGSTKIFKSPARELISNQCMTVDIGCGAALCFLPDPVQPFRKSAFEQQQIYHLALPDREGAAGSLCVLDWVCNGRPANGEDWSFFLYGSRNEVHVSAAGGGPKRLLLRDSIRLLDEGLEGIIAARMEGLSAFGTLILYGPVFASLGRLFLEEFKALPRIGGRKWEGSSDSDDDDVDHSVLWRDDRQRQESIDCLLWSAAAVRGCVVVKFAARQVEGAKRWLRGMMLHEGSICSEFGEQALLCLR